MGRPNLIPSRLRHPSRGFSKSHSTAKVNRPRKPVHPYERIVRLSMQKKKPISLLAIAIATLKTPREIDQFARVYEKEFLENGIDSPLQSTHALIDACKEVGIRPDEAVFHVWRQVLEKQDFHAKQTHKRLELHRKNAGAGI